MRKREGERGARGKERERERLLLVKCHCPYRNQCCQIWLLVANLATFHTKF